MDFEIVVSIEKSGSYTVSCPQLPDCVGRGKTLQEAVENVAEPMSEAISKRIKISVKSALKGLTKRVPKRNEDLPPDTGEVLGSFPISLN